MTVGTQINFDRLISLVDDWLCLSGCKQEVVAQVCESNFTSINMKVLKYVEPVEFERYINKCEFIISHAGMGSILTALRVKKPIIIFPRRADFGEHRNDHQLATASSFANVPGIYVVNNKDELFDLLSDSDGLGFGELKDSDDYKKLLAKINYILEN